MGGLYLVLAPAPLRSEELDGSSVTQGSSDTQASLGQSTGAQNK